MKGEGGFHAERMRGSVVGQAVGNVVGQLILKDWRLHRTLITLSLVGGIVALGLVQLKSEVPFAIGSVWFLVELILLGSLLPASNVLNERKKQNRPFLMNLPISAMQYSVAKLASTFGMFLIPWLALVVGAVSFILSRADIPHGSIPLILVLAGLTLAGFGVITGVAIVCESEGGNQAATIACNSIYGIGWYLIIRVPAIKHDLGSPVTVWSPTIPAFLAGEFLLVALTVALTLLLESRKKNFI
jgi:hypothetical protein